MRCDCKTTYPCFRQPVTSRFCSADMLLYLQPTSSQQPDDPVEAALKKVNEAVNTAEKQLDKLDKLPSAQMPRQVCLDAALLVPVVATKLMQGLENFLHENLLHFCMELHIPVSSVFRKVLHAVTGHTVLHIVEQAHPALQLAVKILLGALAITAVYQSQLYALWLQFVVAGVGAVLVAAYGFSRSSLSSSGNCFAVWQLCTALHSWGHLAVMC